MRRVGHCLRAARDRAACTRAGARAAHRRRPRHAVASGGAGLREMVRCAPGGHRRIERDPRRRHHGAPMLIVGLTGSLGMGKSTAAEYLRSRGLPVFDADAEVHRLYEGAAVARIETAFPGTTKDGRVDRTKLSAALVADPKRFADIEAIVHPLVRAG